MIRYRHSLHVCAQKMEWDGTPINVKETVNTECNFTVPVRSKIHSLIGKWYMDGWWRRRTLNLTSMSCPVLVKTGFYLTAQLHNKSDLLFRRRGFNCLPHSLKWYPHSGPFYGNYRQAPQKKSSIATLYVSRLK